MTEHFKRRGQTDKNNVIEYLILWQQIQLSQKGDFTLCTHNKITSNQMKTMDDWLSPMGAMAPVTFSVAPAW